MTNEVYWKKAVNAYTTSHCWLLRLPTTGRENTHSFHYLDECCCELDLKKNYLLVTCDAENHKFLKMSSEVIKTCLSACVMYQIEIKWDRLDITMAMQAPKQASPI